MSARSITVLVEREAIIADAAHCAPECRHECGSGYQVGFGGYHLCGLPGIERGKCKLDGKRGALRCDVCLAAEARTVPATDLARALDVLRELVDNAPYCQLEDDHEGRMMFVAALAEAESVLKGS